MTVPAAVPTIRPTDPQVRARAYALMVMPEETSDSKTIDDVRRIIEHAYIKGWRDHAEQNARPRARTGDPDTSHEAAASVVNLRETHQNVLTLLRERAMTDGQLYTAYTRRFGKISQSGCRSRRAELVRMGKVAPSGVSAKTASGRRTKLWQAVGDPPAQDALDL